MLSISFLGHATGGIDRLFRLHYHHTPLLPLSLQELEAEHKRVSAEAAKSRDELESNFHNMVKDVQAKIDLQVEEVRGSFLQYGMVEKATRQSPSEHRCLRFVLYC